MRVRGREGGRARRRRLCTGGRRWRPGAAEPATAREQQSHGVDRDELHDVEARGRPQVQRQRRLRVIGAGLPPRAAGVVDGIGGVGTGLLRGESRLGVHGADVVDADGDRSGVAVPGGVRDDARRRLRRVGDADRHVALLVEGYRIHADASSARRVAQHDGVEPPQVPVGTFEDAAVGRPGHEALGLAQERVVRSVAEGARVGRTQCCGRAPFGGAPGLPCSLSFPFGPFEGLSVEKPLALPGDLYVVT
jgi:hypothetical protein